MMEGLVELDRWLEDRMRTGLADPSLARYATWDGLAARLVDARAGSLANRVRRLAGLVGASPDSARTRAQVAAEVCTVRTRRGADVVHLACHARFRTDNPVFSALHLHDGPLTAGLAESLELRAGIVVLSACETGLAEQGSGDEMVGLVRAFLVAGAARVLASLWPVDDAVTAVFMASFYGALGRGQTPAAALQQAQAQLRQQHPHPFHWAAFMLHGGW